MTQVEESRELPPFLTVRDLMTRWSVSRTTLHREVERGRLEKKLIGGSVRFARAEVLRYERLA